MGRVGGGVSWSRNLRYDGSNLPRKTGVPGTVSEGQSETPQGHLVDPRLRTAPTS